MSHAFDWDLRLAEPADMRTIVLAVTAGVTFDAGIRSGVSSLGGWLAVAVAAGGALGTGRLRTTASRVCAGSAVVVGACLVLRTSSWLVPLDLLAVSALLVLAGMLAREGRIADLSAALLGSRAVGAVLHACASAAFLAQPVQRWFRRGDVAARRREVARAAVGLAIAAPVVLVLGLLLASADAIFASMFRLRVPLPSSAGGHVVLIVIGTLGFASIVRLASATPAAPLPAVPWRLGGTEWTVVLASVVALLGAFAVVQVVAITGGLRHVLETEGLTYAEYARTGYVQLLAVTIITGVVLAVVGALADRATTRAQVRYVVLAEATLALTAVVLAGAVRRLSLYEDAYGWTMLRLMAKAGAVWLGVLLVLLAIRVIGIRGDRAWFLPVSVGAALAVLLALNVVNPEALVVRHNLGRATAGHEFDASYLAVLSDDATPALVRGLDRLGERDRSIVLDELCRSTARDGALSWNAAAARAESARAQLCDV